MENLGGGIEMQVLFAHEFLNCIQEHFISSIRM